MFHQSNKISTVFFSLFFCTLFRILFCFAPSVRVCPPSEFVEMLEIVEVDVVVVVVVVNVVVVVVFMV